MIRGILLALVLAGAAWYFGADPWHAVLLGGILTMAFWIVAVVTFEGRGGETDWQESERESQPGARSDILRLSLSLRGRRGRVSETALWQVRRIAERRLAQQELDLRNPADRPRIEQLLGHRSYRVLVRGRTGRQATLRSLVRCLDSLDMLEPTHRA